MSIGETRGPARFCLPAQEGIFVIRVEVFEGKPDIYKTPVVGWNVWAHFAEPVTADVEIDSFDGNTGILWPDGKVFCPHSGSTFRDVTTFVALVASLLAQNQEESE